ncbi:MAG: TetR family transcriptional regulator [Gemmatimonas sp.]|nr:TetR family transcriptional regulator [Gemmatimonas sp.]
MPHASMRAIAREAGCTTGVLTHHFASKKDLVEYASTWLIAQITNRVSRAAQDDLAAGIAELLPLDEARRDEARLWITVFSWSATDDYLAGELVKGHRTIRRHLGKIVEESLPTVPSDQAHFLAVQILAVVDGLTLAALTNPEDYPPAKQRGVLEATIVALTALVDSS